MSARIVGYLRISLLPYVVAVHVRAFLLYPHLRFLHKVLLSAVSHESGKRLLHGILSAVPYRTVTHGTNLSQHVHVAQTLSALGVHQCFADKALAVITAYVSVHVLSGSLVILAQWYIPVEHILHAVVACFVHQSVLVVRVDRVVRGVLYSLPEIIHRTLLQALHLRLLAHYRVYSSSVVIRALQVVYLLQTVHTRVIVFLSLEVLVYVLHNPLVHLTVVLP